MPRGVRGNGSIYVHFEGMYYCQRGDCEFRSFAVLTHSYSQKNPTNPSNKTNTEYKPCYNCIITTHEQYLALLVGDYKFIPVRNALKESHKSSEQPM